MSPARRLARMRASFARNYSTGRIGECGTCRPSDTESVTTHGRRRRCYWCDRLRLARYLRRTALAGPARRWVLECLESECQPEFPA